MSRDDNSPQDAVTGGWRDRFAHRLAELRARTHASLLERREKLAALESELATRSEQLAAERKAESAASSEARGAISDEVIERQQGLLDEVLRQLAQLDQAQTTQQQHQHQLADLVADCHRQEKELEAVRQSITERETELCKQQGDIAILRTQFAAEEERLRDTQERLAADQAALEQARQGQAAALQQLDERERTLDRKAQVTQQQRRQLAQQFRAQKAELKSEADRLRLEATRAAGNQNSEAQSCIAEERAQRDRLQEQLAEREQQITALRTEFKELRGQLDERLEETTRLRQQLQQAEASTVRVEAAQKSASDELKALRLTASQDARRAIELEAQIQPLKQRLAETQAECQKQTDEARRSAAEVMRLAAEMAALAQESDRRLTALHEGQILAFNERLTDLVTQIERLSQEREHQQEQVHALRDAMQHHERATTEWEHRCRELEAQLASARQSGGTSNHDQDDLRRRLDLALTDIRELKTHNQELNEQLAKAKAAGGGAPQVSAVDRAIGDSLDWAERKRLLLEQLETDFDASDPSQRHDRLTIQKTIQLTDQVVAEKDRQLAEKDKELEELHHILSNQASAGGGMAVGAAAIGAMLDQDELIKHERDNLKRQSEELREKLSRAEIDISMERAKLARERAELEDKLQRLEREKTQHGPSASDAEDVRQSGPRGNWLSRLGLKDKQ